MSSAEKFIQNAKLKVLSGEEYLFSDLEIDKTCPIYAALYRTHCVFFFTEITETRIQDLRLSVSQTVPC